MDANLEDGTQNAGEAGSEAVNGFRRYIPIPFLLSVKDKIKPSMEISDYEIEDFLLNLKYL